MLKILLLQLLKAYVINVTAPKKEKKQYSHYFIGTFAVISVILLTITEYIFIYDQVDYMVFAKNLLKIGIIFLWIAVIIKLLSLWTNRKAKQAEYSETYGLSSMINDFIPVAISMIPISIIAYIIWTKIQIGFSGKKERWKNTLRRFLL